MRALLATCLAFSVMVACAPGPTEHERVIALRAPAGPAQLLYAPVGTRIVMLNEINGSPTESTITVDRAEGIFGAFLDGNRRPGAYLPGCWGCSGDSEIEAERYARLWPLVPGNAVSFVRASPSGQVAEVSIRVAGRAKVETVLGAFDTYILDGRIEHVNGPRYSAQLRSWWAPGLGWVIKTTGGDSRGNTVESQIVDFSHP